MVGVVGVVGGVEMGRMGVESEGVGVGVGVGGVGAVDFPGTPNRSLCEPLQ